MFRLIRFSALDSTNAWCLAELDRLADGDAVTADIQTAGRGRLGRTWISSAEDNLYLTIALKPEGGARDLPLANITQYLSVVICRVADELGVRATIKWPNDILIDGKKVAGILAETSFSGSRLRGLVLGVGVNLNFRPEAALIGSECNSFSRVSGKKIDKNFFLYRVLDIFFRDYGSLLAKGFVLINDEYLSRFPYIGARITVNTAGGAMEGTVRGLADDGRLVLEDSSLTTHLLVNGELMLP